MSSGPAGENVDGALPQRVAVTGGSGFIGTHLVARLRADGVRPRLLARRPGADADTITVDLLDAATLEPALAGIELVFHCAGHAHAFEESDADAERQHRLVNEVATLTLARAAIAAGVRRFVFCSSVKAVAEPGSGCVDESHSAAPETAYGRSKRAAETGLRTLAADSGLEVVILRPAMVYGPGSRGNLERMLQLVARNRFPPLPETGNRRSMVFVSDVVDALLLAARRPQAAGRTYIVSHPEAPSGAGLYDAMRLACGRTPSRWRVPDRLLRAAGRSGDVLERLVRRRLPLDSQVVSRLLDSSCYRPDAIQAELGWEPRIGLADGLRRVLENRSPARR